MVVVPSLKMVPGQEADPALEGQHSARMGRGESLEGEEHCRARKGSDQSLEGQ